VIAMIKAMESGAGSISTTHAANAEAALRKLVTCAMEAGPHVTHEYATRAIAENIDLVVQLHLLPQRAEADLTVTNQAPVAADDQATTTPEAPPEGEAREEQGGGRDRPGQPRNALYAIKVVDGTVEVVSEGHWKLFTP
jgi:hypothetical protein